MQYRMKTHPLSEEEINSLLLRTQVANIATLDIDETPYVTPVHYVHFDNKIYIHGLPKGQKIDNIIRNSKVGFSAYDMQEILLDSEGKPCDTNTKYESVIVKGTAILLEDKSEKKMILQKIVEKYTPHLINTPLPDNMVIGTAVIQVSITSATGKFY